MSQSHLTLPTVTLSHQRVKCECERGLRGINNHTSQEVLSPASNIIPQIINHHYQLYSDGS